MCFYFFIVLLFALPSLPGRLRLYLFGLFIHLHIYRTVPAPSIPLGPFLFCLSCSKYVCLLLLFLFRYPQSSCLSRRLSSSRRVGRRGFFPVLLNLPRRLMSMYVCYFRVAAVFFYPFILLFCILPIFSLYILFCLVFSCQFSSSLEWHSLRETYVASRITGAEFTIPWARRAVSSVLVCLSIAEKRFLILILPRFLSIFHVG